MKLKNIILNKKVMGIVNGLALLLVVQTANAACIWIMHQPKFPEEANEFKFKKVT